MEEEQLKNSEEKLPDIEPKSTENEEQIYHQTVQALLHQGVANYQIIAALKYLGQGVDTLNENIIKLGELIEKSLEEE